MNFEFVNFDKSSKELLVGLINKTCRKEFLPSQLIFGAPTAITGNKNTEVGLTSVGAGFFAGTTVQYNRLDLTVMFQGVAIHIADGSYPSSLDIVEDINQTFSLKMGADDVIVEPVVWSGERKYILKAAPGSLIWFGQVEVIMDAPVVAPEPAMETLYPATNIIDLNDLNWGITRVQWFITPSIVQNHPVIGGADMTGFNAGPDVVGSISPVSGYKGHLDTMVSITEIVWTHYGEGGTGEFYVSVSSNDPKDLPNEIIVDGILGEFEQWLPDDQMVKYRLDREISSLSEYVLLEFTGRWLLDEEVAGAE